ncbi:TRAP transporter small permease [Grimontia kaedaensis]|uniref:TRAP transporter small permease protein n=1 Tax=Grimontia kaedaensis TaxID=2872157 RepID=A0ABY4X263_9GAMM|nr:TRAP transporter small permease [Grimontia kaedaensis]USH05332.1 TRAP transporter small permease [Grimontia kaedaensis]
MLKGNEKITLKWPGFAIYWIVKVQLWLAVCAAALMVLLVFTASLIRYFFYAPWSPTEELVGFLFYSSCFLCLPATTWEARHIQISLFDNVLPIPLRAALKNLAALCLIIMLGVLVIYGLENAVFTHSLGARSEMTKMALYPWMFVMPFSLGSMAIVECYLMVNKHQDLPSILPSKETKP